MPFRSEKQRRYLWMHHPDIAERWAHEYGSTPTGRTEEFHSGAGRKKKKKSK